MALGSSDPAAAPNSAFESALEAAKEALLGGELERALGTFERCEVLAKLPAERWRSWLGQALTLERLGRRLDALRAYQRFLSVPSGELDERWLRRQSDVRLVVRTVELDALKTELATVRVETQPAGAKVVVYGAGVGSTRPQTSPAKLFVRPGRYRLRVSAPGFAPQDAPLLLEVGERRTFRIALTAVKVEPPRPPSPLDAGTQGWDTAIIASGAAGGVLLVAGAVLHGLAFSDADKAFDIREAGPPSDKSEAEVTALSNRGQDRQLAAGILYGVGGVALVTTLVLALMDPGSAPRTAGTQGGWRWSIAPQGAAAGFAF